MMKVWIVTELCDGDRNTLDVYANEADARARCEDAAEYCDLQEETDLAGNFTGVWTDESGSAIWYEEFEVK